MNTLVNYLLITCLIFRSQTEYYNSAFKMIKKHSEFKITSQIEQTQIRLEWFNMRIIRTNNLATPLLCQRENFASKRVT